MAKPTRRRRIFKVPGKKVLRLYEGLPKPYNSFLLRNIGRWANQLGRRASIIRVMASGHLHIVATFYAGCQVLQLGNSLCWDEMKLLIYQTIVQPVFLLKQKLAVLGVHHMFSFSSSTQRCKKQRLDGTSYPVSLICSS